MASINGVSSNNTTSSLYNSANVISGLASGMDTEGMIENLVKSYQNKIQTLNNKATKIQWKQDSYRSIINKLVAFSSNYTSYTSPTNLLSASFFNSAVKVAPQGEFAGKVTASGRTDSNVKLNSVSQLATAARYVSNANGLKADGGNAVTASDALDLESDVDLSYLSGSLALKYGGKTVSINFDEVTDQIANNSTDKAGQLKKMIEDKLADQTITLSDGTSVSAADRIGIEVDSSGNFTFKDKANAGNSISISSASDSVASVLRLGDMEDSDNPLKTFQVSDSTNFTYQKKAYDYISGKSFNINVDGVTKSIYGPQIKKNDDGSFNLTMPSTVKDKYGNTMNVYDISKLDKSKYTVVKEGETRTNVSKEDVADAYTELIQNGVKSAFGEKLTVSNASKGTGKLELNFEVKAGSNLLINTSVGETLNIGRTATNYLNTSSSLKDLMKDGVLSEDIAAKDTDGNIMKDEKTGKNLYEFRINDVLIGRYTEDAKLSDIMNDINSNSEAGVKVSYSRTTREFVLNSKETGSENQIKLGKGLAQAIFQEPVNTSGAIGDILGENADYGDVATSIKLNVDGNDVEIYPPLDRESWKGTSIDEIVSYVNGALNGSGMKASFDTQSNTIAVTDKDGNNVAVSYEDDLSKKLFAYTAEHGGGEYTAGQDAVFEVEVNGTTKQLTRGSNSVDVDGLTINFKGTFNEDGQGEAVTFQTSTDSDKIVDAVKSMITDYNEMMAEIRSAYATMPYQNSSGAFQSYEPLSDEDKATMSESAIQNYEAKAKQGILFGDSNLRRLYENMRSVFQPSGADAALLSKIGIGVSFSSSDNATSITLDENKLREALENDPDEVAELFTRTGSNGTSTNGLMQGMKTQLDRYAGLTGATKGILIQQAGTPLNSLSLLDNQWQKEIDNLGTQIEKWQDKLSSQVDRYTSMFSKLEVLINQMNSQSSTLAGMLGG